MKKSIFYLIAMILLISWSVSFFFFAAGLLIHALLIISLIFCLQAMMLVPKINPVAKLSKAERAMKEDRSRSGGSRKKVSSRRQAIVIGLSEVHKEGTKSLRKKSTIKQEAS